MPIKLTVESNSANLSAGGDRVNLSAGGAVTAIRNYNLLTNKPQINNVELVGNKSFAELGLVPVDDFQDGLMSVADYEALKNLKYVRFGAERYPIIGIYAREQGGIIESLVIHVDNGTPDGAGIALPTGDAVNAAVAIINQRLGNLESSKQDELTFDTAPEQGSTNPVTSGGIYDAILNAKQDIAQDIADVRADIPTKTSDLTNDSGFVNAAGAASAAPVQSVNGKSGAVSLGASDVGALPDNTAIPSKTSDLTNDSGFVNATGAANAAPVQSVNGQTGAVSLSANDVGAMPNTTVIPTKTSDLTNDGEDGQSSYVESSSLATVATSGSYNDLSNKPSIPAAQVNADWNAASGVAAILNKPSIPTKTSDLTNDSDFTTATATDTKLATKADSAGASANYAAKYTAGIPYAHVDSTSTATAYTATVPEITELKDGVCVLLKNGVVTSATNFTININGLGAKGAYSNMAASTRETTTFNVNYTVLFVFDETRVEGGCWIYYRGYYSDANTIGYQVRTNSSSLPAQAKFYRYRLLFTSADGTHWVPSNTSTSTNATAKRDVNQTPIDPFGAIVYYGTTTAIEANALVTAAQLWQQYALTFGYSFNRTGAALVLTYPAPVYIKCTPQSDGSAIIDPDTPYVQALPSIDDGKIYIFLGRAYSATGVELTINHPIYYYKNGAVRLWTGAATSAVQTLTAAEIDAICV